MESAPGPLIVATEVPPLAPDQSSGHRRINFLDLPSEVKNLIYYYLYRDHTKRAINLCVLSPAWKSPSPPTALMNTCSTITSELMPVYFSNCLFTIDDNRNDELLTETFKWLKRVGNKKSAHFRRLQVIPRRVHHCDYEIIISITDDKQITIEEIKGPGQQLARDRQMPFGRMQPEPRQILSRLDRELTDDLMGTLTHRINTNGTGAMGATEFEIILERIGFHMSEFTKCWRKLMVKREAERRRFYARRRQV